eukprot:CAMPEP_0116119670 /NCGR_PEP_ID=MMETSP0329-20121206/2767_1 /TAXON_ID=697910 /ORGANISM="Pseudo-nitzschia arenysensis, Strain B593" /LENGTH=1041 /DNA_ID=CAMNT_0003613391 /DNA_START=290 /DNA_END=3415 /DNA_ORIENTATION=-
MSTNNPYSRHTGGNGNDFNRNENTNTNTNNGNGNQGIGNDNNNYHLRNPYSPHAKTSQHPNHPRHNRHQGGGSSDLSRPFNPYSLKTQPQPQRRPASNQYSSSNSSFAIRVGGQPENQQQQQQQQQQNVSSRQNQKPIENNGNNSSSHSVQNQVPHNVQPKQQPQQQKEDDESIKLIQNLRDELDQSNEANFELEASVMALEAELKHTKQTLKEQADGERSKLEHALRLAQQESKRLKQRTQAQQRGRSIVRDAEPTAITPSISPQSGNAFADRLLGDATELHPPSPKKQKKSMTNGGSKSPRKEVRLQKKQSLPHGTRQQHVVPVSLLARSLLEQVKPSAMHTRTSQKLQHTKNQRLDEIKDNEKVFESTLALMDVEKANVDVEDDISIRQVLFSIATAGDHGSGNIRPDRTYPTNWTEGKLVEWLAVTFSAKTSDRYWSTLLVQSSEARKYVRENICLGWNAKEKGKSGNQGQDRNVSRHRRRRNRIRPVTLENDTSDQADKIQELQSIRGSLRNPWWNPNNTYKIHSQYGFHDLSNSTTSQESSSIFFRKWATSLAASRDVRHLHILRIFLAEEAGRKGLNFGTVGQESGAWWDLCYPSIAITIQKIIYGKLIRSKKKRDRRNLASAKPNSYRSSSYSRNVSAIQENSRRRRYRIGFFKDRLQKLQDADKECEVPINNDVTAMQIDTNNQEKTITRSLKDIRLKDEKHVNVSGIKDTKEEDEDNVLKYALSVLIGILQIALPSQLETWFCDRTGLRIEKSKRKGQLHHSSQEPGAYSPCGGLFMVSLILDLLEELQFDQWMREDDPANFLSMTRILSTGVIPDDKMKKTKNSKGKQYSSSDSNERTQQFFDENRSDTKAKSSSGILPHWYDATVAFLTQVGKTREGMEILRSRVLDDFEKGDYMGNAFDVTIRHMHNLTLHLDDARTRHGSILRFEKSIGGEYCQNDLLWCGDQFVVVLLRSVEAWVRFWQQVVLFIQSTDIVSFRALVLDLQDWYTSTCATLLALEEIRDEIKVMIRWQLEELMLDEEDYEDAIRQE